MRRISVVIPARNEAAVIGATLAGLKSWRKHGHEVIVVDGGSTDATTAIAESQCDRVLRTSPGRALQMNSGAAVASGDLFLFLHADTRLPSTALAEVTMAADTGDDCWGRFDVRLDARATVYRVIETLMNWRSRLSGIATGDQAIFVTRELFERCGGYPSIALMEDVALSRILRREAAPICPRSRVTTSARRWQRDGVAATVVKMWWLRAAFALGASPNRLRAVYEARDVVEP